MRCEGVSPDFIEMRGLLNAALLWLVRQAQIHLLENAMLRLLGQATLNVVMHSLAQ